MLRYFCLAAVCFIIPSSYASLCADWPEFRGPFANGHVAAPADKHSAELPLNWSETQNIRWKTPIPYRGWSTPVILGGQVWLTTATEDGHDYYALCIDENSGKILHNKKLFHHDSPEPLGNNMNGYATPSPAIEPGRVYVHFGSFGTACLDTKTGDVLWQRDDLQCRHYRGPSSSVVLVENLVILTFDGVDLQYTVALDKQTGKNVWKTDRDVQWNDQDTTGMNQRQIELVRDGDRRKAHSTPLLVRDSSSQPQLVSAGAKAAFAYDPRTGREIWRVRYDDFSAAPRPICENGIVYLVTGLTHPELWAIRVDGKGDLSDADNILWRLKAHVPKTASPILIDGLIYMVSDDGIITCIDAKTSDKVWQQRIGGSFSASPIYADDKIYFASRDGATTVIKPGRSFEQLAANSLDDGCMASPAANGHALFLRTKTNLYRIEESPAAAR
jgi:outer membrane protein assembly factor BamB